MICPKKLKMGDTVGLICPSSQITIERKNRCQQILETMGFIVKMATNLTTNYGGYMADTGKVRGLWINEMFRDSEVDAIFCVRGGDGGSRAIEYVDLDIIRKNPKIFIGYSDITSFHLLFNQECNLITFHGPMVSSNMVDQWDDEIVNAFFKALSMEDCYEFINPMDMGVLKEGYAVAPITGGNLALLSASMGTPYEMDSRNKIIFIEEVGETMNRIERYAYQLKNAGKFRDCKGVILGQFTDCINQEMPLYNEVKLFEDILREYDFSIMYNIQSGHGKPMITIPLGAQCIMKTDNKKVLFNLV